MKTAFLGSICLILALSMSVMSCKEEDPGPIQNADKSFNTTDFDRISASEAFDVTIQQGVAFSIYAKGDRRNLDDMRVEKNGNTLAIKYTNSHDRQYTTYVTITMPVVYGVDFSGAVNGRATGFTESISRFDISLSGASTGQFNVNSDDVRATVTGASTMRLVGQGKKLDANISGASEINSFDFPAETVTSTVSGASHAKLNVSVQLTVTASGASDVIYRGSPSVSADVSGASSVSKE